MDQRLETFLTVCATMNYRKAAEQGDAEAQVALGMMYHRGDGVPQDETEAVTWFRKAADLGLVDSQYNLGVLYEQGRGVTQNAAEAYKKFTID